MPIVYIVTSGVYSDYRIEGVFSNKHDAEALALMITAHASEDAHVEEWELDTHTPDKIEAITLWEFDYYPDKDQWLYRFDTKGIPWRDVVINKVAFNKCYGGPNYYTVSVRAKDYDSAQKIANEKVMMFIAKEQHARIQKRSN